ncbi:CBN-SBT-1 protein [Caenorhabditis brenneri]|uniref:Neuroendocrine protein 7B2 n=1 Tax=Caenorhabditis brenneri TaxID=135651 RepID=G0NKP2_CAEBE|nr:CBN-SBT-1 protein [Caenorhabditis brenneri]
MIGAVSLVLLAAVGVTAINGLDLENPGDFVLPSGDFIDLISRDAENLPDLSSFGVKHISGGAGEGEQKLLEEDSYQERQEIKSDNVLPAYCEPPNPCPVGFTKEHGCIEEFENSAEFSRNYQAQQHCICDQEHMFNCAEKEAQDVSDSLQKILEENNMHANTIAKKFHDKRSSDEYVPRRKRSASIHHQKVNPYLQGEPLRSMQKKNGKNSW